MRRIEGILLVVVLLLLPGGVARAAQPRNPFELERATRAGAMTAGPDGSVWFAANATYGENPVVGKVTSAGKVTEFRMPNGAPTFLTIATGPDGNVWFGEKAAIGRIDMAGKMKSFALPAGLDSPASMTAGPDGNVWFTERDASRIGVITPAGKVTTFALPPGRKPSGIAAGPDGGLWFTESATGAVGRITTAGQVTEFPVPGGSAKELGSIAAGPDGSLGFTELGAPQVGRITLDGTVTQFSVPTEAGTRGIVAGRDGLLYFMSADQVAAIDTAGQISWPACINEFCDPGPNAMTIGPDGGLWVSTGVVTCLGLCGGGAALGLEQEPGFVKPFTLPPLQFAIGPRLTRLQDDQTTVLLACGTSAPCQGQVRIGFYFWRDHRQHFRVFSHTGYSLAPGEATRVSLKFSPPAVKMFIRYRSTQLVLKANEGGHLAGTRRVSLKA